MLTRKTRPWLRNFVIKDTKRLLMLQQRQKVLVKAPSTHWSPHSKCYFDPVRCVVLLKGQMRRRQFITLGSSAALVWPLTAASAQQAKKIPRLCFLTFDPGTLESTRFKPFFQALRELGYVDGQTITIDYLSANGQGERFADLAADCQRLKADAIFTNWSFP
jgi:hypothetical protein